MWLLWILPLASSFLQPAAGEVVNSFNSCSQFFLDDHPPQLQLNNMAIICQRYENRYHFVTMYDRRSRIPIFSAYILHNNTGCRREGTWKIEPQLVPPEKEMVSEHSPINPDLLAESQAVSDDYTNASSFDKGHLAPVCHQLDQDSVVATFTLTNTVPMNSNLNRGKWRSVYEQGIKNSINSCGTVYAIVGAVHGTGPPLNKRVNVPSYIWAAVCCKLKNQTKTSWAFIAENKNNSTVNNITLTNLENDLNGKYGISGINLFNGACY